MGHLEFRNRKNGPGRCCGGVQHKLSFSVQFFGLFVLLEFLWLGASLEFKYMVSVFWVGNEEEKSIQKKERKEKKNPSKVTFKHTLGVISIGTVFLCRWGLIFLSKDHAFS